MRARTQVFGATPTQHVFAGDILAPGTNDAVVAAAAEFLRHNLEPQ